MNKYVYKVLSLFVLKKHRTNLRKYFMSEIEEYKENIYDILFSYNDLRIVHAYARFYNFGDNALAYGVKNIFLKYYNNRIRFINEDVHTTIFNKNKLHDINKKADIFLVGGGGLIHTSSNKSKFWLFNLLDDDVKFLKKPLILYGLGFNNFDGVSLNKEAITNLNKIKNKAISFSVRNDESVERLSQYNLNFDEIPDPGFFVDALHPRPNISGKYVLLQIAYDAPDSRNTNNDHFFYNMLKLCNYLLEKNYSVILTPHCYPDINISNKIVAAINNKKCFSWDWHQIMREDNVTVGLGYYKHADFVVAMRGHAQICPIGMNVPVISIINHPKHLGVLKKNNLQDMAVFVNDKNFNDIIISKIAYISDHYKEIKDRYKNIMIKLDEQTKAYVIKLRQKIEDKHDKIS